MHRSISQGQNHLLMLIKVYIYIIFVCSSRIRMITINTKNTLNNITKKKKQLYLIILDYKCYDLSYSFSLLVLPAL